MVNTNTNALGIIFPNSYDSLVPDLVSERLMASIPFAGRYRMVDFLLSSMVNSGIDNVSIIARKNYHSLMDHLGSGREWDLTRKNGGLNIVPPYSEKNMKVYSGRVEALASILDFLKNQKEKYVILADTHTAVNFDFREMLNAHIESGADVSIAYKREEIPEGFKNISTSVGDLYYTLSIENDRVNRIFINSSEPGLQNFSMNIYIMDREALMELVKSAYARGYIYFERDILAPRLDKMHVHAYRFNGYTAHLSGMKSYFDENMKLLDDANLDALFDPNPVYTKIREDNPTRYLNGSRASNIMAADGCVIEGDVENSVLFRGVKVGKGATVKNCVLMQDTVIADGAKVEYLITDKNVTISSGKELKGTDSFPVYVAKGQIV